MLCLPREAHFCNHPVTLFNEGRLRIDDLRCLLMLFLVIAGPAEARLRTTPPFECSEHKDMHLDGCCHLEVRG